MSAAVAFAAPTPRFRCWDRDLVEHVAAIADEHASCDADPTDRAWWRQLVEVCDEILGGARSEDDLQSWIEWYEIGELCYGPDVRYRQRPAADRSAA